MNPSPPTAGEVAEAALRLRTAEERSDYITATCEGLPELLVEVEGLLARHMKQSPDDEVGANSTLLLPHLETKGETIGRYRLLQRLGEGGFGVVWEAEQREPVRRRVALKIIKLGMDTHEVIARFEAERQALALMDHPNIARVLDGGATDTGRPYFVMELVSGMPLTQYCDANKLSLRERLELFIPICQAVQHAHQKGIIHRDLKPSNILVSTVDGKALPKVIDFGIARATNQQLTDKTLFTQVGQLIGTPEYMSPEQTGLDGRDVDTRTDIYALGVVLYELLTGRTPLDRERLKHAAHAEIQRIVCEEEPPRPSTKLTTLGDKITAIAEHRHIEPEKLKRTLRGDLDWIVMRALEKDRTRRYDTANGFALDIQRYLNDEPVFAGPPSMRYKIGKFVSRNRAGVAAAAALVCVLLSATAVSLWQAVRATRAQRQTEESRASGEKLVSYMLDDLSQALAPVGRLDLMQGVGEAVLKHYEDLKQQGGTPESDLRHGQALTLLASVAESTGRAPEADRLGNEGITLIRKWVVANQRKAEGLRALAEACEQQAKLKSTQRWGRESDSTQTETLMLEAVTLSREICALPSATDADRFSLARTLLEFIRLNPDANTDGLIIEASETLAQVEANTPLSPSAKLTKAFLIHHAYWGKIPREKLPTGWVKDDRSMRGAAAWSLAQEVYQDYSDDVNVKLELAQLLQNWRRDLKHNPEGGASALAAKIAADLKNLDPSNQLWAEKAANIHLNLAQQLERMRGHQDAAPHFEQAIEILESLTKKQPRNIALKEQLCGAYRSQGFFILDQKETARRSFAQALKVLSDIHKLGHAQEAENERVWLNIFMSQVMPTVDEQVQLLKDIRPLASQQAMDAKDGQAQLAAYYVHGEAVRYLESARRYAEALQEADLSIQAINVSRQRAGDESYMLWHWREAHQSRSRILWRLGRDAEALRDIHAAIDIEAEALRMHGAKSSGFTRLEKMSALLQALAARLQIKPSPDKSEFTRMIDLLKLVVAGFKDTELADSASVKTLGYFLGLARNSALVTQTEELAPIQSQIWTLLLEAHDTAATTMPKEDATHWNVLKHKAGVLANESAFVTQLQRQGRWLDLLKTETKLWREKCDATPNDPDAWLYLGQYLLAVSQVTKMDTVEPRSALQKSTDLWLALKDDLSENKIQSLKRLASIWTELNEVEHSILLHQEWIRCAKLMQGSEDSTTASAIASLISTLKRFGRTSEALTTSAELLDLRRKINGPESHETAVSLREVGALHAQLKSFDEARKHIGDSIALCRKLGEPELPELASALLELGRLEKTAGNWDSAIKLMGEALDLRKKLLPAEHQDLDNLTAELSTSMWNSGTHKKEALRLREELLNLKRGQANPGPGTWVYWLYEYASWLRTEKEYPRAEACAREAFERYGTYYASGHQPWMARKLIGVILSAQGKHDEAGPHFFAAFEAMAGLASTLPSNQRGELASSMNYLIEHLKASPGPPDRLANWAAKAHESLLAGKNETASIPGDALTRLGYLWTELGQHEKAIAVNRKRVELAKKTPGDARAEAASSWIELARALNRSKQLEEAYTAYHEAIKIRRTIPGSQINYLDGYLHELGLLASSLQKRDEAVQLLIESLELRKKAGKPAILQVAAVEHALGGVLRDKGDMTSAIPHFRQALEIRERELGPDHKDSTSSLLDLIRHLKTAGQFDEALTLMERLIKLKKVKPGDADPSWIEHLHEHYQLLLSMKRHTEAEVVCREAIALNEKHFPNGWQPLRARSYLGYCLIAQKKHEEAEQQLLTAYEGLKAHEAGLSPDQKKDISIVLDRLVLVYRAWHKPDKEAEWTARQKADTSARQK